MDSFASPMDVTPIPYEEDTSILSSPPSISRSRLILNPEEEPRTPPLPLPSVSTPPSLPAYRSPLSFHDILKLRHSWKLRCRTINTDAWKRHITVLLEDILGHGRKETLLERLEATILAADDIHDLAVPLYDYTTTTYHKDDTGMSSRYSLYKDGKDTETYILEHGGETRIKNSFMTVDKIINETDILHLLVSAFHAKDYFTVSLKSTAIYTDHAVTTFRVQIMLNFYPDGISAAV
jgi:hypothetical protein